MIEHQFGRWTAWETWPRSHPYPHHIEGHLPQGAPTSGALSNLVMRQTDQKVYEIARGLGMRYTRYSDDLHFSSTEAVTRTDVDSLLRDVRTVLSGSGFRLNDQKTRVARPGSRRSVLGIQVDGHNLRLPSERHREAHVHLRGVQLNGMNDHALHRGFQTPGKFEVHLEGLLSWISMIEPEKGADYWTTWRRARLRSSVAPSPAPDSVTVTEIDDVSAAAEAGESVDRLISQGLRYRKSAEFAEMLRFVGRFRTYAPFNAMLINLQRRGSRYVLTERKWLQKYRRVIRPGAQSLIILRPGGPYMVVFDVGDTEPLPGAPVLPREVTDPLAIRASVTRDELQARWDKTVDNAMRDGVRVTLVDAAARSAGRTYRSKLRQTLRRASTKPTMPTESHALRIEIEINRNLALMDRYATLVHELAHIYCGHLGSADEPGWPHRHLGSRARNEIEAESVTFIVLSRLDSQVLMGDYILGYVESHEKVPADIALSLITRVATEIERCGLSRQPARKSKAPGIADETNGRLF